VQRKKDVLHGQIADQRKNQLLLEVEHHTLKLHMAAREKQRILQEGNCHKHIRIINRS